jgi:hypothetical protein
MPEIMVGIDLINNFVHGYEITAQGPVMFRNRGFRKLVPAFTSMASD